MHIHATALAIICAFLVQPTVRFATGKGPLDALSNPTDSTVMQLFDIQQITAGLFWVQPAAAATTAAAAGGSSSSSSGASGSSTMAAELLSIVPLTLLVMLSDDCGVRQQLPRKIRNAKVWEAAKTAHRYLLNEQDLQHTAGGLTMAFIEQLLDGLRSNKQHRQQQE